jgi:hypothetical protein
MPISRWKVTNQFRNSLHVTLPKYRLHYQKGTIVIPSKSAPGIWVFDTRESAERYVGRFIWHQGFPEILRVLPIGRAIKLKRYRPKSFGLSTIELFWEHLADTIHHSNSALDLQIHLCGSGITDLDGTLIYPAVRVMD